MALVCRARRARSSFEIRGSEAWVSLTESGPQADDLELTSNIAFVALRG
jgi:hypothetical protein